MKEAYLKIDLDSILYNYRHLKCYYQKNVIAVLKDDAYGVGLIEVMKTLQYEKDLIIAINHLNEAIALRKNGFKKDILYLNVFDEKDIPIIQKYNISVIVESFYQLKLLKNQLIRFHIKFNTGMNRIGFDEIDAPKAIKELNTFSKQYQLVGAMTHFADEDQNHSAFFKFEKHVKQLQKKDLIVHCFASNSLSEYFDEKITNYIRVGIKLYGIGERSTFLHSTLTLMSPIISIHAVKEKQKVGYDFIYETPTDGHLYLLPIGYGQGWGRFKQSFAFTNYRFLKQAGKISMDYSSYFSKQFIDLQEEVELFGKNIPLESLCQINDIDPHEILVRLKVRKEYHKITLK